MFLQSTSTAATGSTQTILKIDTNGTNGTTTQTTYGIYATNIHEGTSVTNVGGYFLANTATLSAFAYSLQTGAMTAPTSYGLNIGTLNGATTNVGLNIGIIGGISAGHKHGCGDGDRSRFFRRANVYQLNLGGVSGANGAGQHTGVAIGAISGWDTYQLWSDH